jgi:hypothetical protein
MTGPRRVAGRHRRWRDSSTSPRSVVLCNTVNSALFVNQAAGRITVTVHGPTDAVILPALTMLLAEVGGLRRQIELLRHRDTSHHRDVVP